MVRHHGTVHTKYKEQCRKLQTKITHQAGEIDELKNTNKRLKQKLDKREYPK